MWCSYIAACTSVMQECLSLLRLAKTGAESRLSDFALDLKRRPCAAARDAFFAPRSEPKSGFVPEVLGLAGLPKPKSMDKHRANRRCTCCKGQGPSRCFQQTWTFMALHAKYLYNSTDWQGMGTRCCASYAARSMSLACALYPVIGIGTYRCPALFRAMAAHITASSTLHPWITTSTYMYMEALALSCSLHCLPSSCCCTSTRTCLS